MECRHCNNSLRYRCKAGDRIYYICDHCEIDVWHPIHNSIWDQKFWDMLEAVPRQVSEREAREKEEAALKALLAPKVESDEIQVLTTT